MQKRGHSFLIGLPICPPFPIVDLHREIAESPRTPFVLSGGSMEQRSVGENGVQVGAACGWVGFEVVIDAEEERTSEGSDV